MTVGYVFTASAQRDLVDIWEYIAVDNIDAADAVIDEFEAAARMLAELPLAGHVRNDLTDEPVRFWRVGRYLLVYLQGTRPVEIVRVLHGSRDVKESL